MAVLKKVKSATLVETVIATLLIVMVFMIAGMIINNHLENIQKTTTETAEAKVNELTYLLLHQKIALPYQESYKDWQIEISDKSAEGKVIFTLQKEKKKIAIERIINVTP